MDALKNVAHIGSKRLVLDQMAEKHARDFIKRNFNRLVFWLVRVRCRAPARTLRDSVTNALHHAGLREVNPRSHRPWRHCGQPLLALHPKGEAATIIPE